MNSTRNLFRTLTVIFSEFYEEFSQSSRDTPFELNGKSLQIQRRNYLSIPRRRSILLKFLTIPENLKRRFLLRF